MKRLATCGLLAATLAWAATPALAQDQEPEIPDQQRQPPPQERELLDQKVEPPEEPVVVSDYQPDPDEPQVVITAGEDATFYEYRVNGELREIKVVPDVGPPYYLVPAEGGGWIRQDETELLVPSWVIFRW